MAELQRRISALLLSFAALGGEALAQDEAAAALETRQLSTWASVVARQGPRLQLYAANGRTTRFDSVHSQGDAAAAAKVDYRLTGVTRDGKFFVVSSHAADGDSLYWVSRETGEKVEVYAAPEISPDGRYAVTTLNQQSRTPHGALVWEIAAGQLVLRSQAEGHGNGLLKFQRWTSDHSAELTERSAVYLQFCPTSQAEAATATLRLAPGTHGWGVFLTYPRDVHCE